MLAVILPSLATTEGTHGKDLRRGWSAGRGLLLVAAA